MDEWHQGFYIGSATTIGGLLFGAFLIWMFSRLFR